MRRALRLFFCMLMLAAAAGCGDARTARTRELRAEIAAVERDIDFYINSELDASELESRLVALRAELAELEAEKD